MCGSAPSRLLCGCRLLECCQQPALHRQEAKTTSDKSGTYVISGGLGSLGLLVTQWLFHESSSSFKVHDRWPLYLYSSQTFTFLSGAS